MPEQGYQLALTPAQLYRTVISAIDRHCESNHGGKRFAGLAPDEQDRILKDVEDGTLQPDGAPAKALFDLLRDNTIEGFFADPVYGGNRDMIGWKMIGFPGARGDFGDFIDKHGEAYPFPPVSLSGHRD